MSYSRRSSFSGNNQLPSPRSPSSGSHSLNGGGSMMRRAPSVHLAHPKPNVNTSFCPDKHSYSYLTPTSPIATSPSSTIRPSTRRSSFGSSTTIQPLPRPIPISPSSSFHGSSYLAQRNANLQWALRHNDQELMRTERAAIERYKQSEEARALNLDEAISDGSVESFEKSFEIPIQDTSRPPISVGGVRYNTGRRMSSLANYQGLPVPPSLEPSSYSVNLNGGYLQCHPSSSMRPPSPSSASNSRRLSQSSGGSGIRRPPSPYRASGLVAPFSPLHDPRSSSSTSSQRRHPSPARPHIPSSASDPTGASIRRPPSRTGIIRSASPSSRSSSSPNGSNQPPTRIIHGFHLNSSPPVRSPSPARPAPPSNHSISRGRAGSVSFVAGLGGGNHQQEMMEFQASRDFEVLDGERRRGRHSEGNKGMDGRKGGRTKGGKLAAAERLRKGYSSVGVVGVGAGGGGNAR